MCDYSELPLSGSIETTVPVNIYLDYPFTLAPVTQHLPAGQTLKALAAVIGERIDGNAYWYRISDNTFIWSGACTLRAAPRAPAPGVAANMIRQVDNCLAASGENIIAVDFKARRYEEGFIRR